MNSHNNDVDIHEACSWLTLSYLKFIDEKEAPFFPEWAAVCEKFGIAGQQLPPIHALCLGYFEFS
jgi:hypothetical protein